MPVMPYREVTSGLSSVLSLTIDTLPACSVASSSRMGATALQGPHQGAQKSTMTGRSLFRTSASNVASVVSLVAPTAGAPSLGCALNVMWSKGSGGQRCRGMSGGFPLGQCRDAVSYTHLTLPTNREV